MHTYGNATIRPFFQRRFFCIPTSMRTTWRSMGWHGWKVSRFRYFPTHAITGGKIGCRRSTRYSQSEREVNAKNILTHYHTITGTEINAIRASRTDPRSIQNAKAMFKCIKSSILGDLKSTIFSQIGNLSAHEDGVSLFKELTLFTTVE